MSGWIWLSLGLCALGYEFWALRRAWDRHLPLTFYLRRLLGRAGSPVWWLGLAAWAWVLVHLWFGL